MKGVLKNSAYDTRLVSASSWKSCCWRCHYQLLKKCWFPIIYVKYPSIVVVLANLDLRYKAYQGLALENEIKGSDTKNFALVDGDIEMTTSAMNIRRKNYGKYSWRYKLILIKR